MAELSYRFKVTIDGMPLGGDVEPKMVMAMVEDTRNAPDLFVLSFLDADRKGPNSVLDKTRAEIGASVEIKVVSGNETTGQTLFKGEVTAIETEVDEDGIRSVIRGFDLSHRLFRGNKTRAWTGSYSDIASKIAKGAGLAPGKIDPTSPSFDHVPQFAMSDWDFLRWLAAESNREMSVGEGKFEFRKATPASDGPPVARERLPTTPKQLKVLDLFGFHAMVSAADQVKEVVARGWDYKKRQALMGKAPGAASSAKVGTDPKEIAGKVGNPVMVEVNSPSGNQEHLNNVAQSIAEQIGAAHAEIEFEASGSHELRAGTAISFAGAGDLFDGQGVITTSRHIYEPRKGYRTFGYVTGRQDRSLLALSGGSNGNGSDTGPLGARRIEGVVPAIVENNNDPDDLGRVKLRFPWLDGDSPPPDAAYVSDWARVVQPGAGYSKDPDPKTKLPITRGWMLLPEVGDQVIVAFEQGDIRYPIVIGGVYNERTDWHVAKDEPVKKIGTYVGNVGLLDESTKAVNKRGIRSRTGHHLAFIESKDESGISLETADGKHKIRLDEKKNQLLIESDNVQLTGKKIVMRSHTDFVLQGSDVIIKSDGNIDLKAGKKINLN